MRSANETKTARARGLRKVATDAENALWFRLRGRRLNGQSGKSRSALIRWILFAGRAVSSLKLMEGSMRTVPVMQFEIDGSSLTTIAFCDFGTTRYWATWLVCLKQLPLPSRRLPLTRIADAIRPLPASGARQGTSSGI